jgi:1-phosphofructokinase family hexose kinase
MKLLCITPNPALDRTLTLADFTPGKVFRTADVLLAAGGKGINVARAAGILGAEALCTGFLAGHTGRLVAELAESAGLMGEWTWVYGETRVCTIIVDNGVATVVNEVGVNIGPAVWSRFMEDVLAHAGEVDVVCLCGSFPPGVSEQECANLIRALAAVGKPLWVDSSGMGLQAALETPGVFIKVNGEEIGAVLNRGVGDVESALSAASDVYRRTGAPVVVTLGALGAVMVNADGRYVAKPPQLPVASAVGSGDAFMAALASTGATQEGLRRAAAAGTANALSVGGAQFTLQEFETVLAQINTVII